MRIAALLSLSLLTLVGCNREVPIRADVIYTGGTIYTGAEEGQTVEAVAVGDGVIVFTGDMETAIKTTKDGARIVNIGDAVMFPGFTDSHVHLSGVGQRELTLNLDQVASIEELKSVLASYHDENPDLTQIYGRGWIETHWPEGRFPTAADIDEVVADIPVFLVRSDGHAALANSAALEAAGVTTETEDPDGGAILKTEDGAPNGMLIDNAIGLVSGLYAEPTTEDVKRALEVGYDVYASRGWTGVHNVSVGQQQLDALAQLALSGDIPLRTYNAVNADLIDAAIDRSPSGKRLTTRGVKIFMDGALGSRGALLFDPYNDAPDTKGLILADKDETLALYEKALDGSVQIAIHAIGDRANKLALDWMGEAFETYQAEHPPEETDSEEDEHVFDPRWRIEHSQMVRPEEQSRFADLAIIASMQPSHAIGDLHFAPARVGLNRLGRAYAWKSLMDQGVIIAGGSDAPVEVGDPIIEFYAASVRKDLKGFSAEGWHPEEALSRFEALQLFTQNAAYASFQEDDLGTIEIGKKADFSIFDRDLMTIPDEEILQTKPVMTIVGGDVVWPPNAPE